MISVAHAASGAGADGGMLHDPTFWVALAFIVLMVLIAKPVSRMLATALDDRADTIKAQLDEAEKLREEAQELLASYKRKQQEAEEEAAKILQRAKEEAARLEAKSKTDLENALKRREAAAEARIAQAEATAIAEVQALATNVAVSAAEKLMADSIDATQANAMIDDAIAQLSGQLSN
ncbi:ATP synthase subunit b [Candidatus Terasakiella magnetica]|uniref:ATP synthase subunit b n=1 Tax=Candidatus Terasakiella magnetica TaxID=1867952 RepID=A0A1C3RJF9_9PROT|nr:F0F1 ATP synthase subunit B [Candidatus Terasakiella magnetica]SCA57367.1 ATP synthase subunit b [Candidatus Terasakiella magnetica]